jgi:hypothetical protein
MIDDERRGSAHFFFAGAIMGKESDERSELGEWGAPGD